MNRYFKLRLMVNVERYRELLGVFVLKAGATEVIIIVIYSLEKVQLILFNKEKKRQNCYKGGKEIMLFEDEMSYFLKIIY